MAQLGVVICVAVGNGQSDPTVTISHWFSSEEMDPDPWFVKGGQSELQLIKLTAMPVGFL